MRNSAEVQLRNALRTLRKPLYHVPEGLTLS
jgi:hypothetical protein